ncbi:hypothetical protein GCK72_005261 [Caenorhabditis remanei]|uniref:Rapamycin-insensitive companion of mTOR N-terminal domain-containing protein n=1 Tax=Caenorhabditis remanei TaxID=31234 RepID=A0A6A5HE24_CAERE|nr:hypothetical protein GCK72_005261 [Caenorhabditis remanei]KAF1765309.1 hypothetical protein GCK72_005261 [Caenorhabditis remanei]
MDSRRKVYHKTGNNAQRIQEIRESIRIRARSKKESENSDKRRERYRNREDVEKLMSESDPYLAAPYEEKVNFLNGISKTIMETTLESLTDNEFFKYVCHLMLKFLRDDHPCIRAMCFHIVRKCTMNEKNLAVILTTHVDIYIVRAIDLQMENQTERIEAFKLIIWMLKIYETSNLKKLIDSSAAQKNGKKYAFPKSVMQPIISIALSAFEGQQSNGKDKLSLPCIGLFLELSLTEPSLILEMAGTDWLVKVLTGVSCMSKRIVILASHVLIFWLDSPMIRIKAHLDLVMEQIFAPLVEFGMFQKRGSMMNNDSAHESFHMNDFLENFKCSFLCIIRSWPGLFACAAVGPNSNILPSSPFRLLDYLGLGTVANDNLVRIRDAIVDLCCDFVDVPYASKTFESWEEALAFYKAMHLPDKFKSNLKHDFVIAQNDARLKNDTERRKPTIDLLAAFRVLSQFVLINAQLPLSLARLILAMPDSSSGLKATLLMADMLRQAPSHVPAGYRAPVLSMPTLVQSACESLSQSHAVSAINETFDINAIEQYTFLHATNAELVLNRFDKLNQSWIRSASTSSTVLKESDLMLFAPHMSEPVLVQAPIRKSKSDSSFRAGASLKRNTSPDLYEDECPGEFNETVLRGKYDKNALMMMDDADDYDYSIPRIRDTFDDEEENAKKFFVDSNGAFDWNYMEFYVENIEKDGYEKLVKEFSSNTIEDHIGNMFHFLSPSEQEKNKRMLDRQHVIVAKSIIKLLLRVFPNNEGISEDYVPILQKYVANFRLVLESRSNPNSYFGPRNLSYNQSMLHFAIIGTFTMTTQGLNILNNVGILHM